MSTYQLAHIRIGGIRREVQTANSAALGVLLAKKSGKLSFATHYFVAHTVLEGLFPKGSSRRASAAHCLVTHFAWG